MGDFYLYGPAKPWVCMHDVNVVVTGGCAACHELLARTLAEGRRRFIIDQANRHAREAAAGLQAADEGGDRA